MAQKTSWRLFERLTYDVTRWHLKELCPRIIPSNDVENCHLAWLPEYKSLLRVEAFMKCLEPVVNNENNEMKCLHPSKLGALRCDVLDMKGENDKAEKCS